MGVWFSLFLMASPILQPAHYWTVVSPLVKWSLFIEKITAQSVTVNVIAHIQFTMMLLNNVSGVPLLMKSWDKRYGELKEYKEWRARTNKYIPSFTHKSKREL